MYMKDSVIVMMVMLMSIVRVVHHDAQTPRRVSMHRTRFINPPDRCILSISPYSFV
ncbi:hypothetical protein URH17368_1413 [Alicyclobacillus hesperidum URH17-3-68]|nr:hypothetical protein URH17368_1413 [Alicyclobacillus hesperidum URH17-3-68]